MCPSVASCALYVWPMPPTTSFSVGDLFFLRNKDTLFTPRRKSAFFMRSGRFLCHKPSAKKWNWEGKTHLSRPPPSVSLSAHLIHLQADSETSCSLQCFYDFTTITTWKAAGPDKRITNTQPCLQKYAIKVGFFLSQSYPLHTIT